MKRLVFLGSSQDDLRAMPAGVCHAVGIELMRVQFDGEPMDFKPIPGVGPGDAAGAFRVIYVARFANAVYVLHAFQKKRQKVARGDLELAGRRYKLIGVRP